MRYIVLCAIVLGVTLSVSVATQANSVEKRTMELLFDFDQDGAGWRIIDDGVMGGESRGEWLLRGGSGFFKGELSLENNGGFSSVRSEPLQVTPQASISAFRIRVRGDGRTYQLRVRADADFDGISYRSEFATRAGEWQEISLDLGAFEPVFRGRVLKDCPALRGDMITTVGFLLADKKAGAFHLEVDWIGVELNSGPEADATEPR